MANHAILRLHLLNYSALSVQCLTPVSLWCLFIHRTALPVPAWMEARVWISLINTRASVRMDTRGKLARLMSMSARHLTSRCVSTEPPVLTVRDQTSRAGELVHCWKSFYCQQNVLIRFLCPMNGNFGACFKCFSAYSVAGHLMCDVFKSWSTPMQAVYPLVHYTLIGALSGACTDN